MLDCRKKVMGRMDAHDMVKEWQRQGKRVVFTNGCFDILHAGHVGYLGEARQLGDRLIVGLNSDDSVRRLKGPLRPLCSEADRAEVLSALEAVGAVTVFDEDTPEELIGVLLPDILVKGADWPVEKIAGAKAVLEHGGSVLNVPLLEGRSTSSIIEKVIEAYGGGPRCGTP
ncbi:MAG: D-glycero-beta-D-manno-heptose 1-phosphate adenylyltransferase [Candidatus Chlorobium antarcticum]|jgi:rfaE bifunctional protein nucleotidyltransferase chain/domain|nr:D-glycero-beta-D-manno-heptose 1-phosphate adenylyltransferase [Candidatus Chlorobium antarcticum]